MYPRAIEILSVLIAAMPAPVSRSAIVTRVWGITEREPTAKCIDVHIHRIRRIILPLGLKIVNYNRRGWVVVDWMAAIKRAA